MTHRLGGALLASCGPCNVNASQLVAERVELHRRVGWRCCELVVAVVQGGLVLCNNLPALEDKTEEGRATDPRSDATTTAVPNYSV